MTMTAVIIKELVILDLGFPASNAGPLEHVFHTIFCVMVHVLSQDISLSVVSSRLHISLEAEESKNQTARRC